VKGWDYSYHIDAVWCREALGPVRGQRIYLYTPTVWLDSNVRVRARDVESTQVSMEENVPLVVVGNGNFI
jgi:hypothetical protein